MASNIPQSVFNDLIGTLVKKYFKHLKGFWNNQAFINSNGKVEFWDELNPRYEKWKFDKVGIQNILVFNGNMLNSFETKVTPNGFEIWNATDYFKFHQLGTEHIPARPMLFFDDEFIKKEIDNYLKKPNTEFSKWIQKQFE